MIDKIGTPQGLRLVGAAKGSSARTWNGLLVRRCLRRQAVQSDDPNASAEPGTGLDEGREFDKEQPGGSSSAASKDA